MWWAEPQFRRQKPLKEGGTLGDAFQSYQRQVGRRHPADVERRVRCDSALYLLGWFWELHNSRRIVQGAMLPIAHTEIAAWASLMRVRLEHWEVEALIALDMCFLRVMGEEAEA